MKTLELFNAVLSKESNKKPSINEDYGIIIDSNATWAEDRILNYCKNNILNGQDLNKTFHKSWKVIKDSSRYELLLEQIKHYISTYGSNFKDTIYIPDEVLDIPNVKVNFKLIKAYTKEEMTNKCLSLLQSGIALKEETIDDILSILTDELSYNFTGDENIKNKEAIIKIADLYGVFPKDTTEFFRYIIYKTTGNTLLIKDQELIDLIKYSSYNPSTQFNKFGLEKLASIFNRFKPLFLAFKNRSPKVINRISKLSKKYHKPLVTNPLNQATHRKLSHTDIHWLDNASIYSLFKVIQTCYTRKNGQDTFVYRIRSGKSFVKENNANKDICKYNLKFILNYIKSKYDLSDKKFYLPKNVKYALPTSEKMFVGNIPTGTRFYGDKMAVGIYWENSGGAIDLDLSGLNIAGKIGWNSEYNQNDNLYYSGDITNAPNGAVEYLYAHDNLVPTLVLNNVYCGSKESKFNFIIGRGDAIDKSYMMNPNKLFISEKTETKGNNNILGLFIPKNNKQCFVILNFNQGNKRVTGYTDNEKLSIKALYQQWNKPYTFKKLIKELGGDIIDDPKNADIDLSIDNLEKDSFIKIFD
jgi:hypothetical protein